MFDDNAFNVMKSHKNGKTSKFGVKLQRDVYVGLPLFLY